MVNFGVLMAGICWRVWGTPANFNEFRVLAALLHGTLVVPCSNAAKTRNSLKFAGVPHTTGLISAASGPKFTILWRHVEDILLLSKFFPDCRYVPSLRRYSPTKLCDGAQMAIFGDFFCVLYFQRAACSRFQTCILNSH